MTTELNTLSPKKWVANYSGTTPTIDSSSGVRVGDLAIDSSTTPNKIWKCLSTTLGSPIWVIDEFNISTVNTAYTVTASDYIILANASASAFTVSLPTVATSNRLHIYIKKIDTSANGVTVNASGSELIDGELMQYINTYPDCMEIVCDGSEWYIV